MTIRRILLLAFLLVSLLPAAVLTRLAFDRSRAAMLGEIEQGVMRSTAAVSAEADKLLYERLLNAIHNEQHRSLEMCRTRGVSFIRGQTH